MSDSKEATQPHDAAARDQTPAAQPPRPDPRNGARPARRKPLDPDELAEIELIRGDTTVIEPRPPEESADPPPDASNIELPVPDYHKTPGTMTKRG